MVPLPISPEGYPHRQHMQSQLWGGIHHGYVILVIVHLRDVEKHINDKGGWKSHNNHNVETSDGAGG